MSDKTAATGREIVTQALLAEGAAPGASIHSWRCEHPDRYGPCDCVEQTAAVVVDALAQAGYGDVRALLHDLHQLAADWDAPPRPESPLDVPECSDDLRALTARHTSLVKEDRT